MWPRSACGMTGGTGRDRRHGPAESVRDQPRQPRVSAQGLADQVGAAGAQPFLEQAFGQQIGGDYDTRTVAVSMKPGLFDGVLQGLMRVRSSGGREPQAHS